MKIRFDVFHTFMLIYCSVYSSGIASDKESGKPMRRFYNRWSAEEEKKLIFFDESTNDGKGNQLERIKTLWHRAYPNSNVTDDALHLRIYQLRQESLEEGERTRYFKWNHELKQELLDLYYRTYPYKKNAETILEEEWKRRHKDYRASRKCLMIYVRKIIKEMENKMKHPAPETSGADVKCDGQRDSDLLHVHNIARLEGGAPWKNTYKMWTNLHPQYSQVTLDQLKERVNHLENKPPNKYFPWTEEENKEILAIYYRTMPDREDQGQRIYDIWSETHPRYKFMSPYYLQVYASNLAHKYENQVSRKRPYTKFTNEERSDLVDLYRRYIPERARLHGFHKEWTRKHPRLAHFTTMQLKKYARKLEGKEIDAATGNMGGGPSHGETGRTNIGKTIRESSSDLFLR